MRKVLNLNRNWRFSKTLQVSQSQPEDWDAVNLPHTWNALDGQDGGNDYWRGTATYFKAFANLDKLAGERVILEFLGVAMIADVYVNGVHLAHHEGGYSIFRVDITEYLQEINVLCVTVDNAVNDRVYPQKADFTFYGGIYRDVNLMIVPEAHFELCKDGTPGIRVTPVIEGKNAVVTVETWQVGEGEVVIAVDGQKQAVMNENGYAKAEFIIKNVHLWNGVEDPYLYTASAWFGGDNISSRFGCRSMGFDPQRGFLLNGRIYPLRGVSRHQDRKGLGNALTLAEHREDMEIIREIGANTVRLAHYQHAQEFYDLCDEYGLVVWAEIPYITAHMPGGRQNTIDQMRELITQCYNHPSIVCWGISNEITAAGAVTEDMLDNHRILNELCHTMDAIRPTTMAHAFMLEMDSPLIPIADIGSYNLYFGWYLGELGQNDRFFDEYHEKFPGRVIGFSEYGADANPQFQNAAPDRGDYSEAYQCIYHEHILKCIEERPYLWATYVWNLFDFGADGRDEGGKHGENQKGLVTFDRKIRKDAFYLYKAHWSKEPFVHLCGRRYIERTEDETEIKVYSNQPEITLSLDGKDVETKCGNGIFIFKLPISSKHIVAARAEGVTDTMMIRKADEVNPDYRMLSGAIINWFENDTFDPCCFSIKDTLGNLMKHPEAGAVVGRMMQAARASRGDVAEAASDNTVLQKMMADMTLQSILKQAGPAISPEQIRSLNDTLQKIRK